MLPRSRTTDVVREKVEEYKRGYSTYGKIYRFGLQALSSGNKETLFKRGKMPRAEMSDSKKTKSAGERSAHAHEETVQLWNSASGEAAVEANIRDARKTVS
jgi:hypothetical protein